jgi:hypothetical protein
VVSGDVRRRLEMTSTTLALWGVVAVLVAVFLLARLL